MVKINTITRNESDYSRETKFDITKIQRSTNPNLHQFQKAREYQRALVSVKMDKMFAKPFVGTMQGHSDAISVLSKCASSLSKCLSGSFDGEVRCWDMTNRETVFSLNLHKNAVKGLSFSNDGHRFVSSGDDKNIYLYDYQNLVQSKDPNQSEPMQKYISKQPLGNVDHSWKADEFATSGNVVQIWNYNRTNPVQKFQWGADSILKVKYNPSQPNLVAATGIDRSIVLYDLRGETPLQKLYLPNKCHALSWNPTEPINFTVGSDDGNAYTFDMRNFKEARFIHKDHIQAIMDLDYAPTGKEFVTGSYDKTIRIFEADKGKSREVYHGKRMQIIYSVLWSMDNEFILSGSDDMNLRIWKSQSSKPLGVVGKRQETALQYRKAVQDKFQYVKEIKRIKNHRHLPKYILNAKQRKQEQKESKFKKEKNREVYNASIWQKPEAERKKKIQEVQE
ncbi:WD40-repeat-containing domain [Pseudocohnilembus persalinus]|uniref:WD40-repeat-containing domain n=1 Tax=Pseudocohnilembus persalinus TaxID=266149 RepID=A0A0V0R207_PSEPJ|nr:WD40-repeat-containing domain [Pseudocohnilembus persalinus]|eukprot:KRX08346.1 WD40-repeat-containing domain [Pseudocohnilembus persalinus]